MFEIGNTNISFGAANFYIKNAYINLGMFLS